MKLVLVLRSLLLLILLTSCAQYRYIKVDKDQIGYIKPTDYELIEKKVSYEEAAKLCRKPCGGSIYWIGRFIAIFYADEAALAHEHDHLGYGPKHK